MKKSGADFLFTFPLLKCLENCCRRQMKKTGTTRGGRDRKKRAVVILEIQQRESTPLNLLLPDASCDLELLPLLLIDPLFFLLGRLNEIVDWTCCHPCLQWPAVWVRQTSNRQRIKKIKSTSHSLALCRLHTMSDWNLHHRNIGMEQSAFRSITKSCTVYMRTQRNHFTIRGLSSCGKTVILNRFKWENRWCDDGYTR